MATKKIMLPSTRLSGLGNDTAWIKQETAGCKFKDERLDKRFRIMLGQLWEGMGESIPFACQDWANTKAAYRFFANDDVGEDMILNGHFQATKERFAKN